MKQSKDLIIKWKQSKKYAEFQEKMQEKKNLLLQLKTNIMNNREEGEGFSREELINILQLIKEIDLEEKEQKDEFDMNYFSVVGNSEDIMIEYLQKQYMWFKYLMDYILEEEFEIASELRDVIDIEEAQIIRLITEYRADILAIDEEYFDKIKVIKQELYEQMNNEIDKIEKEQKDEFDMNYFSVVGNSEDILIEYLQKQYMWFRYLMDYILIEEFEIASEIRDVINIEESQIIRLITEYRADILVIDEEYFDKIKVIKEELYEQMNSEIDKIEKE